MLALLAGRKQPDLCSIIRNSEDWYKKSPLNHQVSLWMYGMRRVAYLRIVGLRLVVLYPAPPHHDALPRGNLF